MKSFMFSVLVVGLLSVDVQAATSQKFSCEIRNSHNNTLIVKSDNLVVTTGHTPTETKAAILNSDVGTLFIFPEMESILPVVVKGYTVSVMSAFTNQRGEIAGTDVSVPMKNQTAEFYVGVTGNALSKDGQPFSQGLGVICKKL
ncbi:MAG: hypothetical protein AB7F59_10000 [Bdellovibrionales bacterium]